MTRSGDTLTTYRLFGNEIVDTQDITDYDEDTVMEIAECLVTDWGEKASLIRSIHDGYEPSEAQLDELQPLKLIRKYGFTVFLNKEENCGEFTYPNSRAGGTLSFAGDELKTFRGCDRLPEELVKLLIEEGYQTQEAQKS